MYRLALIIIMFLSVTACSTISKVSMEKIDLLAAPESKFNDEAAIYVFRGMNKAAAIWSFPVRLDGNQMGSIRRGQYVAFPASQGLHSISIICPSICEMPSIEAQGEFSAGKSYYFLLDPNIHSGYENITMSFTLTQINKEKATSLMSTYTYISE